MDTWPKYDLQCISNDVRHLTNAAFININDGNLQDIIPIIDINKYSNLYKLYRITGYVFKFLGKKEHNEEAKLYWLKLMQSERFSVEIAFLKNPSKEKALPPLVN